MTGPHVLLHGAAAPCYSVLRPVIEGAAHEGRAFLVFSDGQDVTALIAEAGEGEPDLLRLAARVLPELQT